MKFNYSKHNLSDHDQKLQSVFEIIPGLTSWTILLGMCALSYFKPLIAALIMIAFYLHWFLRLLYLNLFLLLSFKRIAIENTIDWKYKIESIEKQQPISLDSKNTHISLKEKICCRIHNNALQRLKDENNFPPRMDDIYHLIIYPVVKESQDVFEPGIRSFAEDRFPSSRMVMVLAVEEIASEETKQGVKNVFEKYKDKFLAFLVVEHPAGVKGEAKVKGANTTHAAKQARRYFEQQKIPLENVVVSCFDSDTVVTPDYFSCLTYYYMISPDRTQCSYQPIPVYYNNFWDTPSFARVLDVGASFFQLMEFTNPEKLVTYSSHSMSFKALVDVGYWPVDMISDDSAIYWKAFIHYDGHYRAVPIYTTVSMDIAQDDTAIKTFKNVYKQKRRWAWGVENLPIVMRAFIKSKDISLYKRVKHGFKLFEGQISWATVSILLSIIGWLPGLFAGREFENSVVYYSAPKIRSVIFTLASVGLLNCIVLSIALLPEKKLRFSFFQKVRHALEWLLIPVIMIFLSGLPAIDAQTRMMFHRNMEFWVTLKKHKVNGQ